MLIERRVIRISDVDTSDPPRETREPHVTAMANLIKRQSAGEPTVMRNDPALSLGEYLGDTSSKKVWNMVANLTNMNPNNNSRMHIAIEMKDINKWMLVADFDYDDDGRFLGFRVLPLTE